MPDLDTKIHLNMLAGAKKRGDTEVAPYGLHWGDPKVKPFLRYVRDHWCANHVRPQDTVVEIGPGGGRWTRYLLGCDRLITVDFHQEILDELRRNYPVPHLETVRNGGTDLPGIEDDSVDFVFSFGVFVHLDLPIIEGYIAEIARVLKPDGFAVIQYSDKSKPQAKRNDGFSDNAPRLMRKMVMDAGLFIHAENVTVMPHAGIIRFGKPADETLLEKQTYSRA